MRDLPSLLNEALQFHRAGKLDLAERGYRRILKRDPASAQALHLLGRLKAAQSDVAQAIDWMRQAVASAPDYVEAWNDLGNVLLEADELDEAQEAFQRVLDRRPGDKVALSNLGIVEKHRKRYAEALSCFEASLESDPRYVSAWLNRGFTARLMENWAVARDSFRRALEIDPGNVDILCELALTHRMGQNHEAAVTAYRLILDRDPNRFEAYKHLGLTLYKLDRIDEAAEVFAAWRDKDPADPFAEHMANACAGTATPSCTSNAFIKTLYDEFAAFFDKNLAQLNYHIPEQIEAVARRQKDRAQRLLTILDAGCGTGRCGPLLRPYAGELIGVDLSPRMLARARLLNVYDRLVEDDLVACLTREAERYDLVVAADTLIYFGELRAPLDAARVALCPGGRLIFTVECGDEGQTYRLLPHGRYTHSAGYARSALEEAGLEVESVDTVFLRCERDQPVHGWCVEARKP